MSKDEQASSNGTKRVPADALERIRVWNCERAKYLASHKLANANYELEVVSALIAAGANPFTDEINEETGAVVRRKAP